MAEFPSFEEVQGCQRALFARADSYDTQDWERLRKCAAPTLRIDYRSFLDKLWEAMPIDDFIAMASDPRSLGNPLLKTQHFVGLSKWDKRDVDEIIGTHQLRVPHQKYTDASLGEVAVKGHAHGIATMWYRKFDGVWKFAGVCPQIRWTEYNYADVFSEGREHFGEGEGNK
ncbi:Scytalone dehydratase [Clohesyomyces aquaticus]|uniref:Scytalone dehydratase n=1 Tax=Clohesyomyces aquaticus TaxID=1231657 RepID=A0A1Y1YPP0_9PLEO|nr:Scytalone dehydratase [Clohesyomyces aquaticus]